MIVLIDAGVVACSERHDGGCSYRTILLLLIVTIDVVVDCSYRTLLLSIRMMSLLLVRRRSI